MGTPETCKVMSYSGLGRSIASLPPSLSLSPPTPPRKKAARGRGPAEIGRRGLVVRTKRDRAFFTCSKQLATAVINSESQRY
jgi:hypothetical protein